MTREEIKKVYGEFVKVRATGRALNRYKEMGYVAEGGYFNIKVEDVPKTSTAKVNGIPFHELLTFEVENPDIILTEFSIVSYLFDKVKQLEHTIYELKNQLRKESDNGTTID